MLIHFPLWVAIVATLFRPGGNEVVAFDSVDPASGVVDPVFAYLVGLIDADLCGSIDASVLHAAVERSGASSGIPYRSLRSLKRIQGTGRFDTTIEAGFVDRLELPIPYSILGYRPGKVVGSKTVLFRELPLGDFIFRLDGEDGQSRERFHDVRVFAICDGVVRIDIAGWVDRLAGGRLDDTRVTGLALFEHRGERYGMAFGYNRAWEGRSGALSLQENKIRFPNPRVMRKAARKLRQIMESYEPLLRPDSLRTNGGW